MFSAILGLFTTHEFESVYKRAVADLRGRHLYAQKFLNFM